MELLLVKEMKDRKCRGAAEGYFGDWRECMWGVCVCVCVCVWGGAWREGEREREREGGGTSTLGSPLIRALILLDQGLNSGPRLTIMTSSVVPFLNMATPGVRASTSEFEGVTNTQSITVYLQSTLLTTVLFNEKYTTTPTWKMFFKKKCKRSQQSISSLIKKLIKSMHREK